MNDSDISKFWSRVRRGEPDSCWLWTAGATSDGYGEIRLGGKLRYAHRTSWEIQNGPIPDGLFVLHKCDTPRCVNPSHLFLGTRLDNFDDMRAKGRASGPKGTANPSSKLTPAAVLDIRRRFASGESRASLAASFSVAWHSINKALNGERWKHVS